MTGGVGVTSLPPPVHICHQLFSYLPSAGLLRDAVDGAGGEQPAALRGRPGAAAIAGRPCRRPHHAPRPRHGPITGFSPLNALTRTASAGRSITCVSCTVSTRLAGMRASPAFWSRRDEPPCYGASRAVAFQQYHQQTPLHACGLVQLLIVLLFIAQVPCDRSPSGTTFPPRQLRRSRCWPRACWPCAARSTSVPRPLRHERPKST